MSKYKVGDRVKVVANTVGHDFEDQTHVIIDYVYSDGTYKAYKVGDSRSDWWSVTNDDIAPIATPSRFEIGKTYKTREHEEYTCIHIADNGKAWLVCGESAAYVWDANGKSISLSPEWDVVWEPVVTTHNHVVFAHGESRKTQYNLVNGKVDWDSFEVLK